MVICLRGMGAVCGQLLVIRLRPRPYGQSMVSATVTAKAVTVMRGIALFGKVQGIKEAKGAGAVIKLI